MPKLTLGPAIAGQQVTLDVTGAARLPQLRSLDLETIREGSATLNAATPDGGTYRLAAALDQHRMQATLHVTEPAGGLIGHIAAPQLHAPLDLDLS